MKKDSGQAGMTKPMIEAFPVIPAIPNAFGRRESFSGIHVSSLSE
jgi:hypothetical protein